MVLAFLSEVTVYAGLACLTYMPRCLHERDVQISSDLANFCQTHPTIDDAIAHRANAGQVAEGIGDRLIFRHTPGGLSRFPAAHAIQFARAAGLLVLRPFRLQELPERMPQNQGRAPAVTGWQAILDPGAHGILVFAEKPGDLVHRVIAMDFGELRIRASRLQVTLRFFDQGADVFSPPDRDALPQAAHWLRVAPILDPLPPGAF